ENTLAAFKAAIRTGADGIELDVQRTADGAVVIIHDETVDRTTDGTGRVAEMTLEQLSRLDAGGWFDAQYAGERIPTLEELLQLVRDLGWTGLINIELKNSAVQYKGMENDVIRLIHRFDLADQILI